MLVPDRPICRGPGMSICSSLTPAAAPPADTMGSPSSVAPPVDASVRRATAERPAKRLSGVVRVRHFIKYRNYFQCFQATHFEFFLSDILSNKILYQQIIINKTNFSLSLTPVKLKHCFLASISHRKFLCLSPLDLKLSEISALDLYFYYKSGHVIGGHDWLNKKELHTHTHAQLHLLIN